MIVLFGLSQTSSLIISLSNDSKQSIGMSVDAEEESESESESEFEFDSILEVHHHNLFISGFSQMGKTYCYWKDNNYKVFESLPEIPPPDFI